ncbi:AAA family ATPase, partial [Vibrio parahaemolyticus]|nr:AAA family ATPase [Vibrio parahaemolyticus]
MINYSFDSLNDKEFEELVNDILTQHLGKRVIRYAPGRDLGIDGKVILDDETVIVQSKHYIKSGFPPLLASLKKEKTKIKRLNPHRYIVATSIDLTPANVGKLVDALSPFLKEEDIYFKSTINDLLKEYPGIEKQHYKLWLTSTNVLKHLLNNGIYNLSKFTLEEARKKLNKYTKTAAHDMAMRKLLDDKCVIITGEPGVGKTTLAQQMCNEIVSKGYQFFDIDHDIDEAFKAYNEEDKQIFYYDDFLGSNYLEAFENNKDSKIVRFINHISSCSNDDKLFILTSRASIFSQGIRKSEKFDNNHIESNKFVLNISGLTLFDKASILYNHIYHSQL